MAKGNILNIQLNQSAGFFRLKTPHNGISGLRSIMKTAASQDDASPDYYLYEYRKPIALGDDELKYSLCVFKYSSDSPLFVEEVKEFKEFHVGYLLIVEYGDYISVLKRGVNDLSELMEQLSNIDSEILCNSFIDSSTSIERLAMYNLDASDSAIRAKSVEGLDLRQSFSGYGANRNLLKAVRVSSSPKKRRSVTTGTSFVSETGRKIRVDDYVRWVKNTLDLIKGYSPHKTFLDVFAQSINYAAYKDKLIPVSILFYQDKLLEDIESGQITEVYFQRRDGEYPINISVRLRLFERCLSIKEEGGSFFIENSLDSSLQVRKGASSIYLSSKKLLKFVYVRDASGRAMKLLSYLNQHNCFSVFFDDRELVYNNSKLLKDNQLLGSISLFLDVFDSEGIKNLDQAYSEKGVIPKNLDSFESQTVFRCTEDYICCERDKGNYTYCGESSRN